MIDRGDPASDPDADPGDAPRVRRWDPRTHGRFAYRTRRELVLFSIGALALALVVLGIAWVIITGLIARSQLNQVKAELPRLRGALASGDLTQARSLARRIEDQAHHAHALTSGPAWWVSSNIPVLGDPLLTSRIVATQTDRVGDQVLPAVIDLADQLDVSASLHSGRVDLAPIARLQPTLHSSARVAHAATRRLEDTDGSWLGYVSSARNDVVRQFKRLDGELAGADRAVGLALPMLGQSGPQRYFVGFMNEAESRGLGGIPGAYAIMTADHGKISFTRFGSDDDLHNVRADVNLGARYDARYKQDDPTGVFQNSDISPDFRDAAQIWAGMWEKKTGQHIDGAIAVDPTALSYLLRVTGPATLHDGSTVSAANVVALTQQTQYVMYPGNSAHDKTARKKYLISLAKAIAGKLTHGGDAQRLVRALSHSATERRLVLWSARPRFEKQLQTADWAGALGTPDGTPLSGFVVSNAAGSKLDYYLKRSMVYQRAGCGTAGFANAAITLTNGAPKHGLPAYVTTRVDPAAKTARRGDNRLIVTYYASHAAQIVQATVDGRPAAIVAQPEGDALAVQFSLELPAGKSRTLRVRIKEPAAIKPVQILRQPLVHPLDVTLRGDTCG